MPPLVVEVTRGPVVESRHEVVAAVADERGLVESFGPVDRLVHPRSAVKPFQAAPLVDSGAARAASLDDRQLALACASHAGEPAHVEGVRGWLDRIGLTEQHLECGVQAGRPGGPIAHNCSGKHTGFLTVAVHLGHDPAGYVRASHPVQRAVIGAVERALEVRLDDTVAGIDGCGIPVHPVPLSSLARAAARMPETVAGDLAAAMRQHPDLVAGTGLFDTCVMADVDDVVSKIGAEGVCLLGHVDGGWGIAVKCVDGAGRAAEAVALHLLEAAGHPLSERVRERSIVTNAGGVAVGEVRVVA